MFHWKNLNFCYCCSVGTILQLLTFNLPYRRYTLFYFIIIVFLFCDTSHNTMLSWIFKNCIQINSRTSSSGNSNSPLTRTKFSFPWSKFHWNLRRKLEFPANSNCFSLPFSFRVTGYYCIYWSPSADREESENEKMRKKRGVTVTTYHNTVTPRSLPILPPVLSKQGYKKQNLSFENEF